MEEDELWAALREHHDIILMAYGEFEENSSKDHPSRCQAFVWLRALAR
jgi:hypothetical protein